MERTFFVKTLNQRPFRDVAECVRNSLIGGKLEGAERKSVEPEGHPGPGHVGSFGSWKDFGF